MSLTRRAFGKMALSGVALSMLPARSALAHMVFSGVEVGSVTGSIRGTYQQDTDPMATAERIIEQFQALGVDLVELSVGTFGPVYPENASSEERREVMREFRLSGALQDQMIAVTDLYRNSDMRPFSMSNAMAEDLSDEEIDAMFRAMEAAGIDRFHSGSTRMATVPRLVPFVQRYGITFAGHPHGDPDPVEIGSWESMEKVMEFGEGFDLVLDTGHFTAANGIEPGRSAVDFLEKYHDRISHLHVKDRLVNQGPNMPLGTGDTPNAEILQMIRDNGWDIPAILEREFRDPRVDTFADVRNQLDWIRNAIQGRPTEPVV